MKKLLRIIRKADFTDKLQLRGSRRRDIGLVTVGLAICAALACVSLPKAACRHLYSLTGDSGTHQPQPYYASVTSLDFFRYVSTNTGIPASRSLDYLLSDGNVARLSLDQDLQLHLYNFLEKKKVPYAIFVAVEPRTGRILANVSYSAASSSWGSRASFNPYPMASLFKIVTAAAAFESGKFNSTTSLSFRGASCSESPSSWGKPGRSRDARMQLNDAMAHSVNPAFGRLAGDRLGGPLLFATAQRFGLGANLFGSDLIHSGKISLPSTNGELMRMAAGLDHSVRTSPFHVAMMLAAIGNGGVMPVPSFVDAVDDRQGNNLYSFRAAPLATITSPAVAEELVRSMSGTVCSGTAKRAFADPEALRFRNEIAVAGKTGSINGDDPAGHYNWFAGIAPAANPSIAFAALVVNENRVRVRASQVGRAALDIFFSADKKNGDQAFIKGNRSPSISSYSKPLEKTAALKHEKQ
ncbi:MAG TPA: penicillin-binding transpeptidase domain-containing protein [Desulfuromonadaceae bacterium]|jgi:cell division protein FtsI/penicillin-binding protein 2